MIRESLDNLRRRLNDAMPSDRLRLGARLSELQRSPRQGPTTDARLEDLAAQIERSVSRFASRRAALPRPEFPADLPIVQRKDEIAAAIRDHQVVIVCGETGSGKSTQLPKICLELGRGVGGLIGHTQPRRIAARSVAERVAEELHSPLGKLVGYKVRFTDRTSPDCFIKIMTDGVLLAESQNDRYLSQYDTLIIDEAHERSLNIDFLLGYLRQLLPRRPDLKVIVTSATIDPERFAAHFASSHTIPSIPAPIIEVSGRTYPVELLYRPLVSEDPEEEDRSQSHAILDAIDELSRLDSATDPGDILVFLPGEREIRETAEELEKHHHVAGPGRTEVLPLYARLSPDDQHRVFQPHPGRRRIVLSTNVAETSLTVPGIRYVIDSGLARISRYSTRSRIQGLPIEAISQASANQRSGRCGRTGPGVCIRLYSREDFDAREAFTPPEIVRTNLASVILQMKAQRLGDVESFPFVEPPHPRAIQDGYETLDELGAIDERKRLTDIGQRLAKLPVDPRIARMVLAAHHEECVPEVLIIAAALSTQDPRERPAEKRADADRAHEKFINAHIKKAEPEPEGPPIPGVARVKEPEGPITGSDFMTLVNIWNAYHEQKRHLSSSKLRKWCKENFLAYIRMREWVDVHTQLHRLVTQLDGGKVVAAKPADEGHVHRALLTGLLSNIGLYDEQKREYVGANDSRFSIFPGSAMFAARARWIMAAERVRTTKVYARTVARIRPDWVEEFARHLLKRSYSEASWNERTGTVHVFETVFLYGLEIVPRRRVNLAHVDPPAARQLFIQNALIDGKYQSPATFLIHNQRMLEEARRVEARARRRDLTADLSRRFDFFDKRLPAQITSGGAFERWRTGIERRDPKALCMRLEDLLKPGASPPSDHDSPSTLKTSAGQFPLSYRFEPGEHDDGVTITLPLGAINTIAPGELEWLIPGWLPEKAAELVKSLPKEIRKRLGPTPPVVATFIAASTAPSTDRTRPLLTSLAAHLSRSAGLNITLDQFAADTLPEWMTMRILVTDARGRPLASGRNLLSLRRELRLQIGQSLASASGTAFTRRGMNDWEFGDLPESVEVDAAGARVRAFPAIVDEGRSAGLRLFDSRAAADEAMPTGLRRLFMLRVKGEIKAALQHAPGMHKLLSICGSRVPAATLIDQLSLMVCDRVFLPEKPGHGRDVAIRTFQEFTKRLDAGFGSIVSGSLDVCALALSIFEGLHKVDLKIGVMQEPRSPDVWKPAVDGVWSQLDALCPPGFLVETAQNRLVQFPRYLRAMESRLEKVMLGKAVNDQKWAAELRPHLVRWWEARADAPSLTPEARAALDSYRWMLEEYRVSLFAQELRAGTNLPAVSPNKLDDQWHEFLRAR